MFVCVDAYKSALIITVASKSKPKRKSIKIEIYSERRKVLEGVFFLNRILQCWDLFYRKDKLLFKEEELGEPESFIPRYMLVLEVPCNLEGCFDCSVKIKDPVTDEELEIRSFMTQGTEFKEKGEK